MDIVYVVRDGRNPELVTSLRSICSNLPHDQVWLIGGKPPEVNYSEVNYLPVRQDRKTPKLSRVYKNFRVLADCQEIDDFLLFNDDFYVMSDPILPIPAYHDGLLSEKVAWLEARSMRSWWARLLRDTDIFLRDQGVPFPLNYALHVPFPMNRGCLSEVLDLIEGRPLSLRSVYGNIVHNGRNQRTADVKISSVHRLPRGYSDETPFLSTSDKSYSSREGARVRKAFTVPCKYERRRARL